MIWPAFNIRFGGAFSVHREMRITRAGVAAALVAVTVAGCNGFNSSKPPPAPVDPNPYPANYRHQVKDLLVLLLKDRDDYRGALISPPALKPIGDSAHYVVCLQFNGHNQRKDKMVFFLAGAPTQYIDAKPEQCGDAAYQPFKELESDKPS
jgi:hypothetical protein